MLAPDRVWAQAVRRRETLQVTAASGVATMAPMRLATALVMVVALGGCGASGWKVAHHIAIGTAAGGLACDWHGTRSTAERGWMGSDGAPKYESNPVMQAMDGRKPSPGTIDAYFLGVVALSALGWYVLPRRYRILVPAVLAAAETKAVVNNVIYGVGVCGMGAG